MAQKRTVSVPRDDQSFASEDPAQGGCPTVKITPPQPPPGEAAAAKQRQQEEEEEEEEEHSR